VAAVLALSAALAVTAPARAQDNETTSTELEVARAKVHDLERKIRSGEAQLSTLKERLADLSQQVGAETATLVSTRRHLSSTGRRLAATKARLQGIQDRMKDRARNVYKRGPTSLIDVVLGAKTLAQFSSRMTYAAAIARQDSNLMLQVRKLRAEVTKQRDAQRRLEREQAREVSSLRARQATVQSTLAESLATVSDLAKQRLEAQQLVFQLASKLGNELFGLRQVAGHGMTLTYGEWGSAFLTKIGAPVTRNNLVVMVAWQTAEGTLATWNPLATTYNMPGATPYNSVGVRNYTSLDQGLEATMRTLQVPGHGYGEIVSGLKSAAKPMDTGNAINASDWCRGCAGGSYVVGIIPAVEEYFDKYAG
jgi:peptidoglycan hydrolase CwlO-like protein